MQCDGKANETNNYFLLNDEREEKNVLDSFFSNSVENNVPFNYCLPNGKIN